MPADPTQLASDIHDDFQKWGSRGHDSDPAMRRSEIVLVLARWYEHVKSGAWGAAVEREEARRRIAPPPLHGAPARNPPAQVSDAFLLGPERTPEKRERLCRDIASAINRNSAENGSGTPDFILAEMLVSHLEAYEDACRQNREWHRKD